MCFCGDTIGPLMSDVTRISSTPGANLKLLPKRRQSFQSNFAGVWHSLSLAANRKSFYEAQWPSRSRNRPASSPRNRNGAPSHLLWNTVSLYESVTTVPRILLFKKSFENFLCLLFLRNCGLKYGINRFQKPLKQNVKFFFKLNLQAYFFMRNIDKKNILSWWKTSYLSQLLVLFSFRRKTNTNQYAVCFRQWNILTAIILSGTSKTNSVHDKRS